MSQCYYDDYYRQIPISPENDINSGISMEESDDIFENRQQLQQQPMPQPQPPSSCAGCVPVIQGVEYTQGYLKTQIGKRVRIEFLIGTSSLQDRTGTIEDVGISYIIISQEETNTRLLCDIYSIKFVTFYQS